MSDNVTNVNSDTVKSAVDSFTTAATNLQTSLETAAEEMKNIQSSSESAWINSYATQFITFFNEGATNVVSKVKDTAQKIGEIAQVVVEEDNNIQ